MEVLRPKRDKRRRGSSKNDAIGATAGKGTPVLKSRDSWVEAARTLVRVREICVRTSTAASNAVKPLHRTAPEEIHSKYGRMGTFEMMRSLARKRPKGAELVADSLLVLQALAKNKADELEALVVELVQDNAPSLLKI
jgi:hypothetical protein